MPVTTVSLSEQAYRYVQRKKAGKKYGIGQFISQVLAAEEAREQARDVLEQQKLVTREDWSRTGLCVD